MKSIARRLSANDPHPDLLAVLEWYFCTTSDFLPGRETQPFYCDPTRVGAFAVVPEELGAGETAAIFRLFVMLSMYQALRDVVIMSQQREFSLSSIQVVADADFVGKAIAEHPCSAFHSAEMFEEHCDVWKKDKIVDCTKCPGAHCHVKDGTVTFNRMGDMGKLPTSAWLKFWADGGLKTILTEVCNEDPSPMERANILVKRFGQVHRVGRKLATMIVSALSTPALAPGLTPWFPEIDGNALVVVDTNVARAVDVLRGQCGTNTYSARSQWVREQAVRIDLRTFRADLPSYSPRLIQEALYAFCSKSNRNARGDSCIDLTEPCSGCAPSLCPFASGTGLPAGNQRGVGP